MSAAPVAVSVSGIKAAGGPVQGVIIFESSTFTSQTVGDRSTGIMGDSTRLRVKAVHTIRTSGLYVRVVVRS